MNEEHLRLCGSDEWAEMLEQHAIPWVLEGLDLGDDVIEIGPGPGRTTEVLCRLVPRLTAVEIDEQLAVSLSTRLGSVEVLHADATELPLPGGRFSAALSFTMLHHVPSATLQDKLFAEVARVLRPGGVFAGEDSLDSPEFRDLHHDDICVPVDPALLAGRLEAAGFTDVAVETNPFALRFRGIVQPVAPDSPEGG
jgi:SAM-dependent methyltransferase